MELGDASDSLEADVGLLLLIYLPSEINPKMPSGRWPSEEESI